MGALLDWQIVEEHGWDEAVAAGRLASAEAEAPPAVGGAKWLYWLRLVAIALVALSSQAASQSWQKVSTDVALQRDETQSARGGVWMQAQPSQSSEEDWGTPVTIVTRYFHFELYPRDSAAVMSAAAHSDHAYLTLRQAIGLPEPIAPLNIRVLPDPLRIDQPVASDQLALSAQNIEFVPAESSEMGLFMQQLQGVLTQAVIAEALHEVSVRPQWAFVVDGVQWWLQTCYGDLGPDRCQALRSTGGKPTAVGTNRYLSNLLAPGFDWFLPTPPSNRTQEAASLIVYVVDVYGCEYIPLLLRALGEHNSWHTLAPAVFGISALEFERGWQAYRQEPGDASSTTGSKERILPLAPVPSMPTAPSDPH